MLKNFEFKEKNLDVCLGVVAILGVESKGAVLLYWSGFVYKDDEVICKISVCLGVVAMVGVAKRGLVLLYWTDFVYKDDEVISWIESWFGDNARSATRKGLVLLY